MLGELKRQTGCLLDVVFKPRMVLNMIVVINGTSDHQVQGEGWSLSIHGG